MVDAVKSVIYNETLGRKDIADELEKLLPSIQDETQHDLRVNLETLIRNLRAPQPDASLIEISIGNVFASLGTELSTTESQRLSTVANRLLRGGKRRKTRKGKGKKSRKTKRRVR